MKKIISTFPYEVTVIENEFISLKDGTRLSARIWLPKTEEKIPALLEYIPYRKTDGTRTRDEPMHGYFAGYGYAVFRVDMRGSGESDGFLEDEYLKQEQDDALEVIEYLAKQEWCNGKVGMMGKSWGGFNALQVAALNPQALKAIIVVGFSDDRYNDDIHYKGGCLLNDNFWWGNIMLAYQSRMIDSSLDENAKEKWLKRLEKMPLFPALWLKEQLRNEYYKHGSVCENYEDIKVPVFALDGWADSYKNPVFSLMQGLKVPRKAIIGPWAHVYAHDGFPAPAMGFLQEALKWWDKWLKDKDNDTLACPLIQAYIEEGLKPSSQISCVDGRFVGLSSYPSEDIVYKSFYLSYQKLSEHKYEKPEFIKLNTPQSHGLLAGEWMGCGVLGESPSDQRLDNGMAQVFDSEILSSDLDILGFPFFEISLTSDKPKAMLFAGLYELREDNFVQRISYGVINLTHTDNHSKVRLLQKTESITACIKLDACGHRFKKGSRIRIALATTYFPMFFPLPFNATLTLDLNSAEFKLPLFKGNNSNKLNLEPQSAPLTPLTLLQKGEVKRSFHYDIVEDVFTYITDAVGGVFGEGVYRFDDIGVSVEHNLKRELSIKSTDPLSARYTITQKMKMGKKDEYMDADIVLSKSADEAYFYLKGYMRVKENEQLIFERHFDEKIQRYGV